jgi:hypothetical protein
MVCLDVRCTSGGSCLGFVAPPGDAIIPNSADRVLPAPHVPRGNAFRLPVLVRDSVVGWTERPATLILLKILGQNQSGCLLGCGL